jgi:mRNA-degrading endonuclease YafQ of YafQ-DinJ toxin-antitoxin module
VKPIKLSPEVYRELQILRRKNPKLLNKLHKQLQLFRQNPRHQLLRLHKVVTGVENTWSLSIDGGYRMLYTEVDEFIYFFKIGTHDEVYRK